LSIGLNTAIEESSFILDVIKEEFLE